MFAISPIRDTLGTCILYNKVRFCVREGGGEEETECGERRERERERERVGERQTVGERERERVRKREWGTEKE